MKFKPQAILLSSVIDLEFFKNNYLNWLDIKYTPYWVSRYAVLLAIELLINQEKLKLNQLKRPINDSEINPFVRLKLKDMDLIE